MIQKLGKYAIVKKLGEGSMGAVYKAYDQVLDRHVAIKTMAEGIEWEPEMQLRFYREAQLAAALHHPNIVVIHDMGKEGKVAFIVMELLEGKDLKTIIQSRDPLSLEQKLSIMIQVADGLNHAHKHGIVHRDIKPSNIFVSSSGNVKILDFGIARVPSSDLTRAGVRLGTPVYMAPEQIRDQEYDRRADIFSAGVVFYELIAYIHPFRDKNVVKTLDNIVSENPLSLVDQFPAAPPALWNILNNCLAKDPARRSANMGDVALACQNLLDDLNAASKQMIRELEELLPRLRQASESAGPSSGIRKLIGDAQELLGDARKSDYLTLKPLLAMLKEESASLQQLVPPAEPKAQGTLPESGSFLKYDSSQEAAPPQTPPAPAASPQPDTNEARGRTALERGKSLLGEGRLDEALEQFRLAMGDIGSHPELVNALLETRKRIDEQKGARIAQQLDSARKLIAGERFIEAIQAIDEVLQTENDRTDAMELRRQAMRKLQAEKISDAHKEEGERIRSDGLRLLSGKKYREALASLRQASELLGEDTSIKSAMEEAAKALQAQELQAKMDEGIAKARQLLDDEDFARARTQTETLLKLSPDSAEASKLLSRINQFEVEEQKRNRTAELLVRARDALNRNELAVASVAVREVLQNEPQNAEATRVLHLIDQSKEEQYKREVISGLLLKAEAALSQNDFKQATDYADEALRVEHQNAEAKAFLERIHQSEAERRKQDEVSALLLLGRQALKQQNYAEAADKARQALALNGNSVEAQDLLKRISQAQEIQKQEKIAALLAKGQEARNRQEFIEASNIANEVLELDPQNSKAKSLLKTVAREDQKRQKEQAKAERQQPLQREQKIEAKEATGDPMESTLVLRRSKWHLPRIPIALIWTSLAAILAVIVAIYFWRSGPVVSPPDPLAAAQESVARKDFAKAKELAKGPAERGDPRAKAIIEQAEKGQLSIRIDGLISQAQDLREQGKLAESKDLFEEILKLNPQDERAQRALSEIEEALMPTPQKEVLDQDTRSQMERARVFLKEGKLPEARAEISAALKAHPDLIEAKNLDRKWKRMKQELDEKSALDAKDAKYRQQLADATGQYEQADALFTQGKYREAEISLKELAKRECLQDPRSNALAEETKTLLHKTQEAQQQLNIFTSAYENDKFEDALAALEELRKINPKDPDAERLRDTVTDKWNRQKEARNQAKKVVPPPKPQEEISQNFPVEHPHFFGKCEGTLIINSAGIRYNPKSGEHQRSWDAQAKVSITIEKGKTLIIRAGNKSEKFNAYDARNAKAIQEFWEKVRRTDR